MQHHYKNWLEKLKEIWEAKNPDAIVDLCADTFLWYETPFDEPLTKKEHLLAEWQGILKQEDIKVTYEVMCTNENMGFAHWHATFTRLPSNEKAELDGIFLVMLDVEGKCTEFRQWYNSRI